MKFLIRKNFMYKMPELKITPKMKEYSDERTKKHINLVKKYGNILIDKLAEDSNEDRRLRQQLELHDFSKLYDDQEYIPYIKINWSYKLKQEGKNGLEYTEDMNDATLHHILNNNHHPEYYAPKRDIRLTKRYFRQCKNRDDIRDKFDCTTMPKNDLLEMVADWNAISQERGTNTTRQWADENIGKRWYFDDIQKDFIYKCIKILEEK
jgi:hypothetical protein